MKTVRKLFFAWNEEKERAFLEDMARKGYRLSAIGFGKYIFEEIEPADIVYQFDFKGMDYNDIEEYLQYYKDAGWTCIQSYGGWYYFWQEKNDDTDLSIFNDNASAREKYKRLVFFLLITGFAVYYQAFIIFPHLSREGDLSPFYRGFWIFAIIISVLHFYAVVRLFLAYRKLKKQIRE